MSAQRGPTTKQLRNKIWYRDFGPVKIGLCHWCRHPVTFHHATSDHLVPLAIGGAHTLNNLVIACRPCNEQRGQQLADFLEQHPELHVPRPRGNALRKTFRP